MSTKPPTSPATDTALITPGLGRRMACWMYEGILLFGVIFLGGFLFSVATGTRHALENRHWQQLFMFLLLGLYFVFFWIKGHTLAMKTWHIRMLDKTGRPLTLGRACLRYVLGWIWFLPPLVLLSFSSHWTEHAGLAVLLLVCWVVVWALLSLLMPGKQFLHDLLAGTRLVYRKPPARAERERKWWQL